MSTRSEKRIHGSVYESGLKTEAAVIAKCERKSRYRRLKENCDELNTSASKLKKRNNYVTYPTDDETENKMLDSKQDGSRNTLHRDTLKDHTINNLLLRTNEHLNFIDEPKKPLRLTRRTKKCFDEPIEKTVMDKDNDLKFEKQKKSKKTKKENAECTAFDNYNVDHNLVSKKKTKRRKKGGKRSNSDSAKEEQILKIITSNVINFSGDSFHSAAGSPVNEEPNNEGHEVVDNIVTGALSESSINHRRTNNSIAKSHNLSLSKSIEDISIKTNKSSSRNTTYDKIEIENLKSLDSTFENNCCFTNRNKSEMYNVTYDKEVEGNKHKRLLRSNKTIGSMTPELIQASSIKSTKKKVLSSNSNYSTHDDVITNHGNNFNNKTKEVQKQILLIQKYTSDAAELEEPTENTVKSSKLSVRNSLDTAFKKENVTKINSTFDKTDINQKLLMDKSLSDTAETEESTEKAKVKNKLSDQKSLDTTFEKENNTKFDSTFDKTDINQKLLMDKSLSDTAETEDSTEKAKVKSKLSDQKSLDTTFEKENNTKFDTTFDKTDIKKSSQRELSVSIVDVDDSLKIITFDKSTESNASITSNASKTENFLNSTPVLIESSMDNSYLLRNSEIPAIPERCESTVPRTPMKREGTFTKVSPEPIKKTETSIEKTPTKRMSLPSPGCTPFYSQSIVSQKEKSIMNVTRSIEKSTRRSSLAELLPRATKVMFCSPVDNSFVFTQRKSKIVKSSLKGSSKSFVFDESASSPVRLTGRKRSFTQNDVDGVRAKRKRLADDMQKSVERLSRPRTSTVADKAIEPTTPSKNIPKSLSKSESKVNRTKMPNFAALHQKRFQKMESLDECQERKAKRARQMMTPVSSLMVLERSSPKGSDSPKLKLKLETPLKQKLPTLESLRPGFTRFGFKLNTEGNPFILTNKPDEKPKENKPNGVFRKLTQPSLTGATTSRKEVAKHTVMREKSSTCLKRDVNRKECRTIIKGVRTNRRFELQMQSRNLNG